MAQVLRVGTGVTVETTGGAAVTVMGADHRPTPAALTMRT